MLSDEAVEILMGVLADMTIGIGVDVLLDVNVNAFAGVITVKFAV